MSEPSNKNEIAQFLHCGLCIQEVLSLVEKTRGNAQSPAEYADIEVGWTPLGIQVWCRRHDANVCHIDFEGVRHRANTTRGRATETGTAKRGRQIQGAVDLLEEKKRLFPDQASHFDDVISVLQAP
jgi:hypothetical protein